MSTGLRGLEQSPKQGLARDFMRQRRYSHIPTDRVQVAAPELGPSKPCEQKARKTALVDDTTPAQGDRVAACGVEQPAQSHGDASNEGLYLVDAHRKSRHATDGTKVAPERCKTLRYRHAFATPIAILQTQRLTRFRSALQVVGSHSARSGKGAVCHIRNYLAPRDAHRVDSTRADTSGSPLAFR